MSSLTVMARARGDVFANPVVLGALAPLSDPGLVPAGRDLRDGMTMAVGDVNRTGGVDGRPLRLALADTGAGPAAAITAVEQLATAGITALVGEFHSAVAVPVSSVATRRALPYLCSSATADAVVRDNPEWVFRLAAHQSRGWSHYANHLADQGCRHAVIVVDPGRYWREGLRALDEQLSRRGVQVSVVARSTDDEDELTRIGATGIGATGIAAPTDAVLLLVAYPEPYTRLLRAIQRCPALHVIVGDPAGRVAFTDCLRALGSDAAGIPYLAYLPSRLTSVGDRVRRRFRTLHGREPSFVLLEGYDSVLTLAAALRGAGADRDAVRGALERVQVEGTRGRIEFSAGDHQWLSPVRVDVVHV